MLRRPSSCLSLFLHPIPSITVVLSAPVHPFSTTSTAHRPKGPVLPPRPQPPPESSLVESFLKGSGPGGQKINKTSSAVQLKHLPTGLVVKSQATRSRTQNRKIARRLLAERLQARELGEDSREAVKRQVARRRKDSAGKKNRRKYRRLEEGRSTTTAKMDEGQADDDGDGEDNEVEEEDGEERDGEEEEEEGAGLNEGDADRGPKNRDNPRR